MRRLALLLAGIAFAIPASASAQEAAVPAFARAADLFREIHDRYVGKRFTHVTFLQRTVPA
jgi:hypothetical protein